MQKKIYLFFLLLYFFNANALAIEKRDIYISAEYANKLVGRENIVFVSADRANIYDKSHIKGSVRLDLEDISSHNTDGVNECAPLIECIQNAQLRLRSMAIDNNSYIIIYDSTDGVRAIGAYSYLKSFGHKNVKLVQGGKSALIELDPNQKIYASIEKKLIDEQNNYEKLANELSKLEEGDTTKNGLEKIVEQSFNRLQEFKKRLSIVAVNMKFVKDTSFMDRDVNSGYTIKKDNIDYSLVAGISEIENAVREIQKSGKNSEYLIIDTRSFEEIIGEKRINSVLRTGYIPGALLYDHIRVLNNNAVMKDKKLLEENFKKYGIDQEKRIYVYSQTGTGRASAVAIALKIVGFSNVKVYSGGWNEWGNNLNMPIKR